MSTDIMTNEELLALLSQTQRKLADVEVRLEQAEITVRETNDLLDAKPSRMQSIEERIEHENLLANQKRHIAHRESARRILPGQLRDPEQRKGVFARVRSVKRAKRKVCESELLKLDAREPPRTSREYPAWLRAREPWEDALHEIDHGTSAGGWNSILMEDWLREANIPMERDGDQTYRLSLRVLNRLIAQEDAHIARIEREAAAVGLTLDDLRKAETNWTPT